MLFRTLQKWNVKSHALQRSLAEHICDLQGRTALYAQHLKHLGTTQHDVAKVNLKLTSSFMVVISSNMQQVVDDPAAIENTDQFVSWCLQRTQHSTLYTICVNGR